ncbi:thioredoxin family protein [uncultured Thomasclavelia sp.]|uniref:thioredoxin family protein n=1 Tax=uncultured Thomasclavelia sp. TaxID=3025759 RepID=UPI0025F9CB14|nr:thioredoxin family protein [uncultured Thomasclavelia sp.]
MKKIITFIIMILLISGCQFASINHIQKDTSLSGIHELNYQELEEKLNSDDLFVLYIGRPDCGDCQEFYPILTAYLQENEGVYLYYLNIQAFRDAAMQEDASDDEIAFYDNMREELDFDWTPTLKLVNNGETIDEYTYLSSEYYEIEDEEKRAQAKQEYIDEFETWMSNIYE